MEETSTFRGLHPGIVLDRELRERKIGKSRFALSVNEYPQTLVAITKGKRRMNAELALKIEEALGFEEGYFMVLQAYYDIREIKRKKDVSNHPDLSKLSRSLFWDTKIEFIEWQRMKRAVIQRVFERGDKEEQEEIVRFYGKETVDAVLAALPDPAERFKHIRTDA
jgi:addiction module HigA family antidote